MQLPEEFIRRMQPLLGKNWQAFLAAYEKPLRRGLRVNTGKISADDFISVCHLPLTPSPFAENSFYIDNAHKAGSDPLHHAGAYYMQEPSASSAVCVLDPQPHEKILDLCAAPGGKSTQILAALGDSGLLWSNEYISARARILQQNLERCGARRQVISNSDTATVCTALRDYFDAVLVDAPCSGEGMFRKEPQALTEWSLDNIHLCAARQTEILSNAAIVVRPGGRLVYSTCTFAPEENEAVIARFLQEHDDYMLKEICAPWGVKAFSFTEIEHYLGNIKCSADLTMCRRIFPQHGGEGHFIALLQRKENAITCPPSRYVPPATDVNRQAAKDLYADCFVTPPVGEFVTFGGLVRLLPPELPDLHGINIISAGIAVAEVCKNRLEPCHSAFMATALQNCKRFIEFSPDDARLRAFLHGEELPCDGDNGWTAIGVAGMPVGFGKLATGRLKNRYPKGLRLL